MVRPASEIKKPGQAVANHAAIMMRDWLLGRVGLGLLSRGRQRVLLGFGGSRDPYFFVRAAGLIASWFNCALAVFMLLSIASIATLALRFSWE